MFYALSRQLPPASAGFVHLDISLDVAGHMFFSFASTQPSVWHKRETQQPHGERRKEGTGPRAVKKLLCCPGTQLWIGEEVSLN